MKGAQNITARVDNTEVEIAIAAQEFPGAAPSCETVYT